MVEVAVYRPERSSLAGQEFTTIKHFQLKVEECLVLFLAFLCVLVPALAQTLITNRSNRVVNGVIGNIVSYVIVTWFITLRSPSCSLTCGLTTCGRVALMENKRCSLSIEN